MSTLPIDIESLLSAAVATDASDLTGLADLHGRLLEMEKALRKSKQVPPAEAAAAISRHVESIVLNEFPDPAVQLEKVASELSALRDLLDGKAVAEAPAASSAPVAAAPAGASAAPAGPSEESSAGHHSADALTESMINPDDVPLVQDFLAEATEHLNSVEAGLLKLESEPDDNETINAVFRGFHSIKGAAGFLHLKQISALAHAAESLLDAGRRGEMALSGEPMDAVLQSVDIAKVLLSDLAAALVQNRAPRPLEKLPSVLTRLETALTSKGAKPAGAAATASSPESPAVEKAEKAAGTPVAAAQQDTTVKVATDRLDQLINMVGELVIAESMVARDASAHAVGNLRLTRNLGHLAKITRELQELSMSLRMVPVQGVFQKMNRLVRDTARKLGKQVELILEGGETELDRTVVESLSDPLVHMVRNSVDHGVEFPEDRVTAGKPRSGKLILRARHEAGCVVIEIIDDGKGIDASRVLKKAREAGIVGPHQELPDAEIYKLIFHPGLSTAEKLTDVSGRGVGMDVVKKNVEKLRGRIEIASTPGKGSTFTLRLPLTLAVIDGLLVSVGSQTYVLPLTSVERNLRPTSEQLSSVLGKGEMLMLRGELMPLVRLHRVFGIQADSEDPTQSLICVVHDDSRRCGLVVDKLIGQQQVVIKSLGYGASGVPGVAGGAILGDGNVSLIIDVPGLIELSSSSTDVVTNGSQV